MKKKLIIFLAIFSFILPTSLIVKATIYNIDLNGYVVYVDAGHGGKDNGANYQDVMEDSINLNIATYLVQDLIDNGASVVTSRDGDYDLASNYDTNRKNKDLKRRVELINFIKPDIFISIHLNTFTNESVSGGQVFAQNNDKSKLLAESLQENFNKLSSKEKKIKIGDYYLLNKAKSVGVIVECGFLTNSEDRKKLSTEKYQREISENIIYGIHDYFLKINKSS